MNEFAMVHAAEDWNRFTDIFNRKTIYAPYSIPLTRDLINTCLLPSSKDSEDYAFIGWDNSGEGIIHFRIKTEGEKSAFGQIYILFADSNKVALQLMTQAEKIMISKGADRIFAGACHANPYQHILHGAEVYVWGGAYPAINAYRKLNYDILHDIICMKAELSQEPHFAPPDIPGLEFRETGCMENELAWFGSVQAYMGTRYIGNSGYIFLKAISEKLKKRCGQINIWTDDPNTHGSGIGPALLSYAHRKLFDKGVRKVILATNQSLFRAVVFYEKMGYQAECIKAYSYIKELD